LFVGILLKRGHRNLPMMDGVFWLLLGMPLVWLEHGVIMHMGATSTIFIMLKQAVNGVFNAILVNLAICFLPLGKIFPRSKSATDIPLQETLFNLLVMMVLIPALLLTMLQTRKAKESLEAGAVADLQSVSSNVRFHLDSWFRQHLQVVQELARLAGRSSMAPAESLQHDTEVLKQVSPSLRALHVENAVGRTIAFSPNVNEKGESTIGHDFSDRAWFQESKAKKQPVVSEVFHGRIAVFSPLTVIAAPVIVENQWLGVATASVDLGIVQEMLKPYGRESNTVITVTDSQRRVIATTAPDRTPMAVWDRKSSGAFQPMTAQMYHWYPDDRTLPSMTRWQRSFYVQETSLGPELPWRLAIEVPVAPLQRTLYAIYVNNLAIVACLIGLALLLSLLLSRWFTSPLVQLAQVTAKLPGRLSEAQDLDWPASSALEINWLIANARSMARTLEENFRKLRRQSDDLRESEAQYRTLFESSTDGILLMKDQLLDCNEQACKLWCCERGDIIGRTPLDFSPPVQPDGRSSAEAARTHIDAAFAGEPQFFFWQHRRKDGVLISCEISLNAIMVGGTPKILATMRDITERRRAEEEHAKLAKLEAVGTLAGGIAHDFNNILMAILGNISLAGIASNPAGARERLAAAEAACDQAQSLAKQLLTFAKGGTPVKKAEDLKEIVQEAAGLALSGSKARAEFALPDHLWKVCVDRAQIHQVFSNLFINADQAMPTGGVIQVGAENLDMEAVARLALPPGKHVAVTLADRGVGIAPPHLERIFDPYFTTKQKGSGLGLATAYSIIKQHGGRIAVESYLGRGTTFRLYLPALEIAGAVEKPAEVDLIPGQGRILVMDDDATVRDVVGKMLDQLGYDTVFAEKGQQALQIYQHAQTQGQAFAATILDLTIPGGMGGRETMQHLLALDPHVKAVVSSGYADNSAMADFRALGFLGAIAKPYRLVDLGRVLQEVLNGPPVPREERPAMEDESDKSRSSVFR
jgi:PAS domain S-box-containing protein